MVPGGEVPLFDVQGSGVDWGDQAPVVTNWAPLEPPPAKADRLQGSPGNPIGREDVPVSASHERIHGQQGTTTFGNDGSFDGDCHHGYGKARLVAPPSPLLLLSVVSQRSSLRAAGPLQSQ